MQKKIKSHQGTWEKRLHPSPNLQHQQHTAYVLSEWLFKLHSIFPPHQHLYKRTEGLEEAFPWEVRSLCASKEALSPLQGSWINLTIRRDWKHFFSKCLDTIPKYFVPSQDYPPHFTSPHTAWRFKHYSVMHVFCRHHFVVFSLWNVCPDTLKSKWKQTNLLSKN